MTREDRKASILAGNGTWSADEQRAWLAQNRQRNISRAFELLQHDDWHSVMVLAQEILEDGDDVQSEPSDTTALTAHRVQVRRWLVDAMLADDWIEANHLASRLQIIDARLRGRTSRREDRRDRIDWLRRRIKHQRYLMQDRLTLVAFLRAQSEESAELEGLESAP